MTVRKTVGAVSTLAQGAVSTATSVVRHPIGTAALAAGFAKGITEAGLDLVRSSVIGASPTPPSQTTRDEAPAETLVDEAPSPVLAKPTAPDVERELPGPDLVAREVHPDDLPEPIVIEAEPAPSADAGLSSETGVAFHHEPHAASRDSDHGGHVYDREDAEGYADEIPDLTADPVAEELVYSSESTLEDEPVLDSAVAKTVRSEADVLQKAADPHKD